MTRNIKTALVLTLVISIIFNSIFPITVFADSADFFSRDNLITIAKGLASLYLLNKANSLINERNSNPQPPVVDQSTVNSNTAKSQIDGKIIVIDAGHGGYDPGAVGAGGLKEKDVTLDIALQVYKLLKNNTNTRVYLTRDKDQFISLNERSAMANSLDADIFISIHINGAENGIERGIETYAHYNSPEDTWALAWYIQESLVKELGLSNRGIKADNFHVVRETNMESVLLEVGFITDQIEENLLKENSTRERAARAIYNGILTYYSKGQY